MSDYQTNATFKTADELLSAARSCIERLTPPEVLAALQAGAILVDIRCEEDRRKAGVIKGGVHIPRTVLEWRADPSSAYCDPAIAHLDAWLIIMCNHGYSSSLAAANLRAMGFTRLADMNGGFEAWQAAGLPVETY
ncbi:MAG: rhodanese-like domain-containing protein [Anaerolineae bacterium]|nr:rhodanese-like domain-containing protein [Anaerolineae bacterium]